jgi:hypothetical protein
VIAAHTPSPGRDVFGAAYEELRRRVLTGSAVAGARGLVLLLRDGLAAWMSHVTPGATVSERAEPPDRGAAAPRVSDALHAAVVCVLTSMALDGLKARST